MKTKQALTGFVTGRVQGVGFRYFTQDAADTLGLTGWVRNTPDKTVEFFAQGDESDLAAFKKRLQQGPPFARVERVDCLSTPVNENLQEFVIRH